MVLLPALRYHQHHHKLWTIFNSHPLPELNLYGSNLNDGLNLYGSNNIWQAQSPCGAVVSPDGTALYYSDSGQFWNSSGSNCLVRKLDLITKMVTTVAGVPLSCTSAYQGPLATNTSMTPKGLALYGSILYIAGKIGLRVYDDDDDDDSSEDNLSLSHLSRSSDAGNYVIWRLDLSTGIISLYAGTYGTSGYADGPATSAKFYIMTGIVVNPSTGDLYIADSVRESEIVLHYRGQER